LKGITVAPKQRRSFPLGTAVVSAGALESELARLLQRDEFSLRPWPRAEKQRIVAAAGEPGTVASEVARQSFLDRVKRPNTQATLLGALGDIAGAGSRFPDSVSDGCVDDLGIN